MAAGLSYYAFASLIPLLILAIVVALFIGDGGLKKDIIDYVRYHIPAATDYIVPALNAPDLSSILGIVSLLISLWGALKIFRGVDVAFSRIYGSEAGGIVDQIRDGIAVLGSIALGIVGITVVSAAIAILNLPFANILGFVVLLLALCIAFFPLYYILPDVDLSFREVIPGTVFAAVGWSALGTIFGIYADAASKNAAGAVGAILLLLTWFYFSGVLLLIGAVINATLGNRLTDRQVQQGPARQDISTEMSDESDDAAGHRRERDVEPHGAVDINELEERISELQAELDEFETDVNARTVKKPDLERELKKYVRSRMNRGHARGWGPYLVLLYGTVLTLAAFTQYNGWLSFVMMIVIFFSTLGLYVMFILFGSVLNLSRVPVRAIGAIRNRND